MCRLALKSTEGILFRSIFITPPIIQAIQVLHQRIKDDDARASESTPTADRLRFNGRLEVVLFARKNQLVQLAPRKPSVWASCAALRQTNELWPNGS
jgi:hypothetical protein